jgi:hypothetical protein
LYQCGVRSAEWGETASSCLFIIALYLISKFEPWTMNYEPLTLNPERIIRRCIMKKALVLMVMVAVSVCYATTLYAAQKAYYVQSVKAKVMSSPSFKAGVIVEMHRGDKLYSSGRKGSWIKVKVAKKYGYISSMLVATHPPFKRVRVIKGDDTKIQRGVRRRASSYTSAAAARGLTKEDRRRLSKEEKIDYDSLEKIESFQLDQDEIDRFMEGKSL